MTRRVATIIWTYGRPDIVVACVESVLSQSHPSGSVVVIDSASRDDTAERLGRQFGDQVRVVVLEENLGPGGAIAAGLAHIDLKHVDYLWFVEDDSRPRPTCLADLLDVADRIDGPAMVGPDGAQMRWGQWYPLPRRSLHDDRSVAFVFLDGALVDASAVAAVAPPRDDYFIMMVDVEYPLRLAAAGVVMRQVGVDYETLRLGAMSDDRSWRTYYQTRNHLHMALSHRSPRLFGGFLIRTAKQTVHAIGACSGTELRLRARGMVDALRGRMGRIIDPPGSSGSA